HILPSIALCPFCALSLTPLGVPGAELERQRRPKALPLGLGASRSRNHMYGLDQPHPARPQPELHPAVIVSTSRQLLSRMLPVHGNDQRARERTVLVRQAHRQLLTIAHGVWIPFGHEFEGKTEWPIALRFARRSRKHEAFRAA